MKKNILQKEYPDDYSEDATKIINLLSFSNGENIKVLGSMSLRSQLYASDFDCFEIVESQNNYLIEFLRKIKKQFQNIVKRLEETPLCYIGDIKCGCVEEWQIIKNNVHIQNSRVINYNQTESKEILYNLYQNNIINSTEYKNINNLLKPSITPNELLDLKNECKFHIVRWSPDEIYKGEKELQNNLIYTLEEGFKSPSLTKIDVISWVNGNRFTDFSCIYQFNFNNKPINGIHLDIDQTLKDDILALYDDKHYYKMSKRLFALSKYNDDLKDLNKFTPLFNGDLGRIYQIYGDIGTIENLVENDNRLPIQRLRFESDQFKNRLSNITLPAYLIERPEILNTINHLENIHNTNRPAMLKDLKELKETMGDILNTETKKYLIKNHILPLNNKYLH